MAYKLGKKFKRGRRIVRYAYRGGRKGSKILVTKVKRDSKRAGKRIVIAGVTYLVLMGIDNLKYNVK